MNPEPATPSRELNKLWREWIELHAALDKGMPKRLAAPFFSACSRTICDKRILFVGKATNGEWSRNGYKKSLRKSAGDAVNDRILRNFKFVQDGGIPSAFWDLFFRLNGSEGEFGPDGVIWSNVAKIGAAKGNPSGVMLSAQTDLAERTLRTEIVEYRPALTIFVTGSDPGLSRIINRALGVSNDDWQKSEDLGGDIKVPDVWWRKGPPAALWTRHPQGAPKNQIGYWIAKAQELIGS